MRLHNLLTNCQTKLLASRFVSVNAAVLDLGLRELRRSHTNGLSLEPFCKNAVTSALAKVNRIFHCYYSYKRLFDRESTELQEAFLQTIYVKLRFT